MLTYYDKLSSDLSATPVIKGVKSPSERFIGADDVCVIEGLMKIDGCCSVLHHTF